MSRILARALGGSAGPEPVLPRLPTPFEPGLELATGPGPLADEPEAAGPFGPSADDRAVRAVSPAVRPDDRPADSWPEPPPAAPGVRPGRGELAAAASPPVPQAGPTRRSGFAEPSGLAEADSPRPGDRRPAYPVRPGSADSELAEPPAPRSHPARRTADPDVPLRPADPAPVAAARAEPAGRRALPGRRLPDPSPAAGRPAPRRAARLVQGPTPDEPVVHITIGQVEIRADRAAAGNPPAAARPTARPRRAAPDLSEYLQRRGRPR